MCVWGGGGGGGTVEQCYCPYIIYIMASVTGACARMHRHKLCSLSATPFTAVL